jgi:hypothetical protein
LRRAHAASARPALPTNRRATPPRVALRQDASRLAGVLFLLFAVAVQAHAQGARIEITGKPEIIFDSAHDGCEAIDVPDINPRAYRDDEGHVVMFALHFINRALRGPDLDHLKLDCRVALTSPFDPDPAHYDDRNYIAATWTRDGRDVEALVHHEYHADDHASCAGKTGLACWYNSVLAYRSHDGGSSFAKDHPLVVASAPFGEAVEQGRHRGFFNPSNIFSDGTYEYVFAATTGWQDQPFGACLFRTMQPTDPASWRAYDGRAFSIRYADPYASPAAAPKPCAPVGPFVFPVGAVVRDQASSRWIAVFQAARNDGAFPVDGFYYASSTDLLHWSEARLLFAAKTLFSDLCTAGPSVIAYPSLLDPHAKGRNFDDLGDDAYLYFTLIKVDHCKTGQRLLMRQKIAIIADPTRRR